MYIYIYIYIYLQKKIYIYVLAANIYIFCIYIYIYIYIYWQPIYIDGPKGKSKLVCMDELNLRISGVQNHCAAACKMQLYSLQNVITVIKHLGDN